MDTHRTRAADPLTMIGLDDRHAREGGSRGSGGDDRGSRGRSVLVTGNETDDERSENDERDGTSHGASLRNEVLTTVADTGFTFGTRILKIFLCKFSKIEMGLPRKNHQDSS